MQYQCHIIEPLAKANSFRLLQAQEEQLPSFAAARPLLPQPLWAGHEDAIACYWKVWEIAFSNLRRPSAGSSFVANFIDTAFNDCLFLWDSVFILMFGRYGARAFNFQRTLDNLYAKQHDDGFICREIRQSTGQDAWERFDPSSTGPNVLAWSEWEYYRNFADRRRLEAVWPVLMAYHRWCRNFRTWPDGAYWSSGWGCGMDNQPRLRTDNRDYWRWHHGHMSWIDACCQQVLSARLLAQMAGLLDRAGEAADMRQEAAALAETINRTMWDDQAGYYFDRYADGALSGVKSVAGLWALLSQVATPARAARLAEHLEDPRTFNRPHRVPTLAADHAVYDPAGGYWRGGVWPPTNYMILRGLTQAGGQGRPDTGDASPVAGCFDDLAAAIARNHLDNVVAVFRDTGTVWENYAPEAAAPGKPAKPNFVGWSGLGPIAVLFEYVFGLRPAADRNRLLWDIRLTEEHGVSNYPFGAGGLLDLHCAARRHAADKPVVTCRSNVPLELEIRWPGGQEMRSLGPEA